MSFLLDTNICSANLRNDRLVSNRYLQHSGGLFVSTVTLAELNFWLRRKKTSVKYRQGYAIMLTEVVILDLAKAIAEEAGEIGAQLRDMGRPMPTPDVLIAATALVHGLTLVSHNTRHFVNVPGLTLVDWLVP